MSKSAHSFIKLMLAVVLITLAALVSVKTTWAASGNVQICIKSASCTVGEFLYDDSYVPLTTATCQITSRYPDGTLFLNAQAMTVSSEGDAWYAYAFTSPTTTGLYRTEVKCTVGSDVMALDKTFEVQESSTPPSTNDIAAATWSYSSRSLSTFGNLVADIWNSATRTLTGAGLTSGSIATKEDVSTTSNTTVNNITNVGVDTSETRKLLERLVNKPIIETTAEEEPDLSAKIKDTELKLGNLYKDTDSANSKVEAVIFNWSKLSETRLIDSVEEVNRKFGGENDKPTAKSIFGYLNSLNKSWEWDTLAVTNKRLKAARDVSFSLQAELESKGKSKNAELKAKTLAVLLTQVGASVGEKSSKGSEKSLFGRLNEIKLIAKSLDSRSKDLETLLSKWGSYKYPEKKKKIASISEKLVEINKIPSVRKTLLSESATNDKELKNKSYYVLGIISSNKKLLAKKSDTGLANTWLELGSIVFKSLVTNPSTLITQDVELKYYLPPELKEEDIIEADPGLEVKYDTEKDQFYVTGEFELGPSDTKTVSVRTQDIWVIKQTGIDSLRTQASELSKPLEHTSFFAQGVTLKTDIDASLDKVENLMSSNTTPESKIRSYREAQIELKAAREKIEKLKELATQAGSAGAFFGFVGGTQALAVWGLILILTIGFVSITIYMRVLTKKEKRGKDKVKGEALRVKGEEEEVVRHKSGSKLRYLVGLSVLMLFIGTGIGLGSGIVLSKAILSPSNQSKELARDVEARQVLGDKIEKIGRENIEDGASGPEGLRPGGASESADLEEDSSLDGGKTVTVKDTPTGFLRVRKNPSGTEIAKVYPGDSLTSTEEKSGWFKIELEDGTTGWISGQYASEEPLEPSDE